VHDSGVSALPEVSWPPDRGISGVLHARRV